MSLYYTLGLGVWKAGIADRTLDSQEGTSRVCVHPFAELPHRTKFLLPMAGTHPLSAAFSSQSISLPHDPRSLQLPDELLAFTSLSYQLLCGTQTKPQSRDSFVQVKLSSNPRSSKGLLEILGFKSNKQKSLT